MTLVSIVLPTKDRPRELARAVRTVLAQTHEDWELLVVDDASEPAAAIGVNDPRIHVHRHDTPRGVSAARNMALASARGEWVALLDDDDLWAPEKLERQLACAEHTGAELIYTSTLLVDARGRVRRANPVHPSDNLARDLCRFNAVGEPSSVLVRRAALEEADGFSPDLSVVADWDLWLSIAPRVRAQAIVEPLTGIVEHEGSMQVVDVEQIEHELSVLWARHADLLARHGATHPNAEMRLYLASKRWLSRRTVVTSAAYLHAALRAHGLRGAAVRIARRARARRTDIPPWLTTALTG